VRRSPILLIGLGALAVVLGILSLASIIRPSIHLSSATSSVTPDRHSIAVASPSVETTLGSRAAQASTAAGAASAGRPGAVAVISIPSIGIHNAPVYDRSTDSKGIMQIAPGFAVTHFAMSAPFGSGNAVIYGHDDIQGNIFGRLYDLAPGDTIQVSIGGQMQAYRVTGHQIVPPTDLAVLNPTGDARLTVITCWPFNVDTKRWIVTAIKT